MEPQMQSHLLFDIARLSIWLTLCQDSIFKRMKIIVMTNSELRENDYTKERARERRKRAEMRKTRK